MSATTTVVIGNYPITFSYQGKDYVTSVYRRQTAYSLMYIIKFKTGSRKLEVENGKLCIRLRGKPLEQALLDAIYEAILVQVEPVAEKLTAYQKKDE